MILKFKTYILSLKYVNLSAIEIILHLFLYTSILIILFI